MPVPMIDVAAATLLVCVYQSRCYCAIALLLIVVTMLLGYESNGTINECCNNKVISIYVQVYR